MAVLSTHTDVTALKRTVAHTRQRLYLEIIAALALPDAPLPFSEPDHQFEPEPRIVLTPSSLNVLRERLPTKFKKDRGVLAAFFDAGSLYGQTSGEVIWEHGVGRMAGAGGGFHPEGVDTGGLVHVFLDHSNILFGLISTMYNKPIDALPPRHLRVLSLPCVSLLLRRGRLTPPGTLHAVASSPLQQDLDPLVRLGWEVSILKRVEVYEDEVVDHFAQNLIDKPMSHPESHASASQYGLKRYREQGVDEILHLKLLQTLNSKPTPAPKGSTIVLATGDAKGGQFNKDGFLGAVREAISRGWAVELWAFKSGLSRTWWTISQAEGWTHGGRFSVYYLDDWAYELVEMNDSND
ncbi:hypothetical protein M231_07529 [Tremella mesenterica]|uniref:NYN domain-containing protein n=1 Tax=Tremella mesenterica TaxID=5217 RepID=A0A4Q1BBT8_TREME|nr:hypothetical protein M231_07529 [Tremella mesenterica]